MLSVTAGNAIFFSVQLSASVRQLAAYIEVNVRERETMQVGEAECDNQALRQCHKQKGFTESWECLGTCTPLEFNEYMSGAGVRVMWVSLLGAIQQ